MIGVLGYPVHTADGTNFRILSSYYTEEGVRKLICYPVDDPDTLVEFWPEEVKPGFFRRREGTYVRG